MLKIEDLEVSYGAVQALRGISMEVNDGEIVSLIGANGAGKTTTLHAIADRAYVLENGRITMSGGARDLLHDDKVRKAYLGA